MKEFCLLIGTNTEDTMSTFTNIRQGRGCSFLATDEIPPTKRGAAVIELSDMVYVVSHGNDTEWGDDNGGTSIKVDAVIKYFVEILKQKATVHFYVCESLDTAKRIKKLRMDLTIFAAKGSPDLLYNQFKNQIEDSSGNYIEVTI